MAPARSMTFKMPVPNVMRTRLGHVRDTAHAVTNLHPAFMAEAEKGGELTAEQVVQLFDKLITDYAKAAIFVGFLSKKQRMERYVEAIVKDREVRAEALLLIAAYK